MYYQLALRLFSHQYDIERGKGKVFPLSGLLDRWSPKAVLKVIAVQLVDMILSYIMCLHHSISYLEGSGAILDSKNLQHFKEIVISSWSELTDKF